MHPVVFYVPGTDFPIRSFGLMVVLGFLLGSWVLPRLAARSDPGYASRAEGYAAVPVWVLISIMIGARLLYVIVELGQGSQVGRSYIENPLKVLYFWEGGLVMYGGTAGAVVGGILCCRKYRLPTASAVDVGTIAAFAGLVVGRIGCLLVGDDYGRVVPEEFRHLPFPITIRVPAELPDHSLFGAENAGQVLWATQIWMSFNVLVIALVGTWLLGRRRYPGQVFLVMMLAYSITRGLIEMFRGDAARGFWYGLSTSQWISLALGLASLAFLIKNRKRREGPPAGPGP